MHQQLFSPAFHSAAEPVITPQLEQQTAMLLDLTRGVMEAEDFSSALQGLLKPLAQATAWCYGEVWAPDPEGRTLHSLHAWHDPDPKLVVFAASSAGLPFTLGVGQLGRAWQHRQVAWVPDFTALDATQAMRPERVVAAGLRAALFLPIIIQDEVVALLSFFAREVRPVNEPLIRLITLVAAHIGVAIRRLRDQEALRTLNSVLEARVAERTMALRAANCELERTARLKDEFLANMSHELRTPLNVILSLTESVTEGVYGPMNERQAHALNLVGESGRHLLALINDILDLTKIESGKVELNIERVDVANLCMGCLRMVRQLALVKQLRVSSVIDPLVDSVPADPRRLKQIIVNLLSNAVKFTPEGGSVSIELQGDRAAGVIHVSVTDTGIGINPDDLKKLFQPFVQLDSRLDRRHEGSGLGLALVARLAELHGGGVSVTSVPGEGSCFTASLPWPDANGPQPAPAVEQLVETSGLRPGEHPLILIAEDNVPVRQVTVDYLTAYGYQVYAARDGAEALTLAREHRPDVILMDIQMPVLDGFEVTRRLRADPELATTQIIALTALAMVGDRERCIAAGVNDYLSKPIRLSQLLARIEALRRSGRTGDDC